MEQKLIQDSVLLSGKHGTSEEGLGPFLPFNSLLTFHFDLLSLFRESGVPLEPSI